MTRHATAALLALLLASPAFAQPPKPAGLGARPGEAIIPATPVTPATTATPAGDYVIGIDDVLDVTVWREKDLSGQVAVRPDGAISLPLLNDIAAAGLTPLQLADRIKAKAAAFIEAPTVTVAVKQINSRKAFITGEITRPGAYVLTGPTTVLQLIAMAGGLTEFADREHIAILRQGAAGTETFTFDYKKATRLKDVKQNITLQPGDTVLVR